MSADGELKLGKLSCVEGFESGEQIQIMNTDPISGLTSATVYEYDESDGWTDTDEYEPVGEIVGIPRGASAWFIGSSPKKITTSGALDKLPQIHTFNASSALCASKFPVPFCPNSENISWGVSSGTQIQIASQDELGLNHMTVYEYDESDGWTDTDEYEPIPPTTSLVDAGVGFWLILKDASETFTEYSPIAD